MTQLFVSGRRARRASASAQNAVIVVAVVNEATAAGRVGGGAVIVVTPLDVTLWASCVLQTVVHLWTLTRRARRKEEDTGEKEDR